MSFRSVFGSMGAIAFLTNAAFAQAPTPKVPPLVPAAAGASTVSQPTPAPDPESGGTVIDAAVGSAFTYQGLLRNGSNLAQGSHDFIFALYADSTGSTLIGSSQTALGVDVNNGFFTVALDFGAAAFDGNARWLDVQVRPAGAGAYTALTPRQALRPVPYATRAINGPAGSSQWVNDSYGIDYPNKIGVGTVTNPTATAWINSGSTNNNTLYVTSSNGPWAALAVRNYGTNGWGIYDDISKFHYLYGNLGLGTTNPGYPVDILNTAGGGLRIAATGSAYSSSYPGEGVKAALFVHGYSGSGLFGAPNGGIFAQSTDSKAVTGFSDNDWGVWGNCDHSHCYGVLGTPNEGIFGYTPSTSYPAAHFLAPVGGVAIVADGVTKTKTLQIMGGSDLAEPFDVARGEGAAPEPGTVVVIDAAHPGDLAVSERPYDTRVAGVISGANGLTPGMVMQSDAEHAHGEHAVALTGRVWCKVDASFGAVHPGDLLVSSPTPGYAMRATDVSRRAGAVLGKAMTSLEAGQGLVLLLVSLQ